MPERGSSLSAGSLVVELHLPYLNFDVKVSPREDKDRLVFYNDDCELERDSIEEEIELQKASSGQQTLENSSFDDILKQHVPSRSFPFLKRIFGDQKKRERACQHEWFAAHPWMLFDRESDVVKCYPCVVATAKKWIKFAKYRESAFIDGFSNWNDGSQKLKSHADSAQHLEAMSELSRKSQYKASINEALSAQIKSSKDENAVMLTYTIETLKLLTRQNLAVRGGSEIKDGKLGEYDSNFNQVMQFLSKYQPDLTPLLRKKHNYTSPEVQNELLGLMGTLVTQQLVDHIQQNRYYCVMLDETPDIRNKEQVVVCLRHVDADLVAKEDYVALVNVPDTKAATLHATLKDVLAKLNLSLRDCRGQRYDGASSMKGAANGLKTEVLSEYPLAIYIDCYGHSLNLAVQDAVKSCKLLSNTLDCVRDITKLIKRSPKRDAMLEKIKDQVQSKSGGVRTLCRTRWTVRASCLKSILQNYEYLLMLWDNCLQEDIDSELRMRITGVQTQMTSFNFLFGIMLGLRVFSITDNLVITLQGTEQSASSGSAMAKDTVKALQALRNDDAFHEFYIEVDNFRIKYDVEEAFLPRRRKVPAKLALGPGHTAHQPNTIEDLHRQEYFAVLDRAKASIEARFDQPGFETYSTMQDMLLQASNGQSYDAALATLKPSYSTDVDFDRLDTQLAMLHSTIGPVVSFSEAVKKFKALSTMALYSEVKVILHLIMILPATNAVSERSFSTLGRLKTYLRSSMTQERLQALMTLTTYKEH